MRAMQTRVSAHCARKDKASFPRDTGGLALPCRRAANRLWPMIDKIGERVDWVERNLLPHERDIRAWLRQHRVPGLEIDDIIQEMYARIGSVEDLEAIRTPKRYALRVAHSILLNHIRRLHIVSITPTGSLEDLDVPSREADPEQTVAAREEMREVANAVRALPLLTRQVLLLRRLEELSQRETAHRLGIPEKAVEKHLARAVLFLTNHFGRGGKTKSRTSNSMVRVARGDKDDET